MNAYDFDDTIFEGQSAVEFLVSYVKSNPKLVSVLPSVIKTIVLYKRQKIVFEEFEEKYAQLIKDHFAKDQVDLRDFVKDFWDKNEHKVKSFYADIQQEDDLIITASPYFLMEEICQRLGIKNLIASDFNPTTGEMGRACFREEKIKLFQEAFPEVEQLDAFYTDSLNDKFMFPISKKVFLVDGEDIKRIK